MAGFPNPIPIKYIVSSISLQFWCGVTVSNTLGLPQHVILWSNYNLYVGGSRGALAQGDDDDGVEEEEDVDDMTVEDEEETVTVPDQKEDVEVRQ